MKTADKIEAALDRAVENTKPGPMPPGEVWGAFVFGCIVGGLAVYWFCQQPAPYVYHLTSPGIILRVETRTGAAAWTYTDGKEPWHKLPPP